MCPDIGNTLSLSIPVFFASIGRLVESSGARFNQTAVVGHSQGVLVELGNMKSGHGRSSFFK